MQSFQAISLQRSSTRGLNPRFLSYLASCDATIVIWWTLLGGRTLVALRTSLITTLQGLAFWEGPGGRGLHSFPVQLNLSSSVHRVTQLNS